MAEKHIAVQGATLKCKHSVAPQTDKLKVLSQTKDYANDKDGSEKLIATTMEIGTTMEKNTFGNCKLQPAGTSYLPCVPNILKWSGEHKNVTLSNKGKALLEDSKATCPIGGTDCIEIVKHGQKTEPSEQNAKNANPDIQVQINPMVNLKMMVENVIIQE